MNKIAAIWRMQFQMHILEWKLHIWIKISLKIALKDLVDKQLSLVQVMAWHQTGNKPLSETRLTKMLDTTRNITYQQVRYLMRGINGEKLG